MLFLRFVTTSFLVLGSLALWTANRQADNPDGHDHSVLWVVCGLALFFAALFAAAMSCDWHKRQLTADGKLPADYEQAKEAGEGVSEVVEQGCDR